jgi:acetylglutamate kinase
MRRAAVKKRSRRRPIVLKVGGELLDERKRLKTVARLIARVAERHALVIVHGGGKEIDAALTQASIPKHQVDGLRITDEPTLQVVVAVLAGSINTRLVAAVNAAGGRAVGLTGADSGVGIVRAARPHRATNGELVDLGLVGEPSGNGPATLLETLYVNRFVPVVACIGASRDGRLFNVNADTLAGALAARLGARRLLVAGVTPGVLNADGETISELDVEDVDRLVSSGAVTAGMVAKLRACRHALNAGVGEVAIADGRRPASLADLLAGRRRAGSGWTRLRARSFGKTKRGSGAD